MKFNVIKLRYVWFTFSGLLIAASIAFFAMWGLKQGIEFTGGSLVALRFGQNRPSPIELQQNLESAGLELGGFVIQPVGEQDMQLRLKSLTQEEHEKLLGEIKKKYSDATELRFDTIGPVIGNELRQKTVRGLAITLLAILIYVAITFRKVSIPVQSWKYGVITIFTAFHDVIVPIGLFALLGYTSGYEIGTPFVAALLTILGYSITDTIVVLDRVRENLQKTTGTFEEIVNSSVRQTFLRSFNTSMSTLLTLLAIFLFGGRSLHDFTLTLIVGIAVGTYSSIFVASPLLVVWERWSRRRAMAK